MTSIPVSVVVVSRDRPDHLTLCLTGLSQVQYDAFEIVVVADNAGLAAARELEFASHIKLIPFDTPNISAARNLGISHSAGDIIAFIDDDAVPFADWLTHLVGPAAHPHVAAMGGFVRGRNGIGYQWCASSIGPDGHCHELNVDPENPTILSPPLGHAVKTEGTNMAVRRADLVDLGGFDPAYAYFLDETDLNVRLAHAGRSTSIVPAAQVHHLTAANQVRNATRAPRDLFEIGASWAVFQRKFLPEHDRPTHWSQIRAAQRVRLLQHMQSGSIEPGAVRHSLRRLDDGYAQGKGRDLSDGQVAETPVESFRRFPASSRPHVFVTGRLYQKKRLTQEARLAVAAGNRVTMIILSPTAIFHRLRLTPDGIWLQQGGIFGKSTRTEPIFKWYRFADRIQKERKRFS